MKEKTRLLLRVAAKFHSSLPGANRLEVVPRIPESLWWNCTESARKIFIAKKRGWSCSLGRLEKIWRERVARFQSAFMGRVEFFAETIIAREVNSVGEIYRDLTALDDEFDNVECDLRNRTISVTTEPIVLEDFYLGPFQICLNFDKLEGNPSYTVLALSPQYAAAKEDTVHPHVENDVLCEGDGSEKIAAALKNGCLFEFFILVRQVLETYNPGSAYVSLSDWDGVSCPGCGDTANDDNLTRCEECSDQICLDCARFCWLCSESSCGECALYCADCSSPVCSSCRRFCDGCDDLFCKECLNEEYCRECKKIREEETEKEKPTKPDEKEKDADAALQPLCLGEVTLLP